MGASSVLPAPAALPKACGASCGSEPDSSGLEPDPALCARGRYTLPFGVEAAMRLMTADNLPTALYSANYEATFGTLGALVHPGGCRSAHPRRFPAGGTQFDHGSGSAGVMAGS